MARQDITDRLVSLTGAGRVLASADGWPSLVEIPTYSGTVVIAAHAATVSSHARKQYEWRVQSPASGKAVSAPGGSLPLYLAPVKHKGRIVVFVADASYRLGIQARSGPLFRVDLLNDAASFGWAYEEVGNGQTYYAVYPRLLPVLIELMVSSVEVDAELIKGFIQNAGYQSGADEEAGDRARRTVSAYVRDKKFSKDVRAAYRDQCAMCRIDLGLIAGAHIFPVSAAGSTDKIWNGLALCHNHHAAFDAHNIWIAKDYSVSFSPALKTIAAANARSQRFLDHTRPSLWVPAAAAKKPRLSMLSKRYAYYEDAYAWAPPF